jgi:hypothetical protein
MDGGHRHRIMASVDLVARLVDVAVFRGLCSLPSVELATALAEGGLRDRRPEEIPSLDRAHDIDAEAEFLDWYDTHPVNWTDAGFLSDLAEMTPTEGAEGLRLLSDLASPGAFRCWEGRAMLYLDVLLQREVRDLDDLYDETTWRDALAAVGKSEPNEYAEKVVLSWMAQREDLGETLDAKQDPRLMPTMEAHQEKADALHRTLQTADIPDLFLLVGRDWTDASAWGQGEWNLGRLIREGLP